MRNLKWLIERPIAHRGLHGAGAVENTASAFSAAIAGGYGIECDLQMSADGEAMVHHDEALDRLTEGSGRLDRMHATEIAKLRFKQSADRILTLRELCELVAGRTALLIELKSRFDGDARLAGRVAAALADYAGPAAAMSFDPRMIEHLRQLAPALPRGIVAQRRYDDWHGLPPPEARRMARLTHVARTRPHFIAYRVGDLPAAAPRVLGRMFALPLLAWTVRSEHERRHAARWADQIIFEGWRP